MKEWIYRVDLTGVNAAGVATTFRYATKGYQTSPAHPTLANQAFEGRVRQALLMRRDLYGAGRTYGPVEIAAGTCILENSDGGVDGLTQYGFDNQEFWVWRIDPTTPDTEVPVFRGLIEDATLDVDALSLRVRDHTYKFDRQLQLTKYAGTGGVEGDANSISGKPKPICWGVNLNIEPVLVNELSLIYQLHDTAFTAGYAITVYDMRSPIVTRGADYVSQADMLATAPASFSYRVWPGGGMFRLGSRPVGRLTVDLTNPAPGGNSWYNIAAEVINRVGGFGSSKDIAVNYDVGVYWTEEITAYEAFRELVANVNGSFQAYPNLIAGSQQINFMRLEVPGAVGVLELDRSNIVTGSLRKVVPADRERGIPPYRITCNFALNRTVMAADELAGSAAVGDVAFAGLAYRSIKQDNAAILTQYPNAPQMVIDTNLGFPDAGNQLVLYFVPMYATRRSLFSLRVPIEYVDALVDAGPLFLYGLKLASTVKVTYPRFNMNAGVFLAVLGYSLDYQAGAAELLLWGATP